MIDEHALYQLLKQISYSVFDDKQGIFRTINHIAVEVDSGYDATLKVLVVLNIVKSNGTESKTAIKRNKLDPSKTYNTYYIGGGTSGHAFIRYYEEKYIGTSGNPA